MINSQKPICGKRMKDKIFHYCSTYTCPELNTQGLYERKSLEYITYGFQNPHVGIAMNCCTKGCNEKEIQDFCCGKYPTSYEIRKNDGDLYGYEQIEAKNNEINNHQQNI
uniref:Insulin-like domain-containing protein n=1 Tax=Strongyloides papillosus TaxID=174720 RepID=A0A0N5C0J0_STREA